MAFSPMDDSSPLPNLSYHVLGMDLSDPSDPPSPPPVLTPTAPASASATIMQTQEPAFVPDFHPDQPLFLQDLTPEILLCIFEHLGYWDLKLRVPRVCKFFQDLLQKKHAASASKIDRILFRDAPLDYKTAMWAPPPEGGMHMEEVEAQRRAANQAITGQEPDEETVNAGEETNAGDERATTVEEGSKADRDKDKEKQKQPPAPPPKPVFKLHPILRQLEYAFKEPDIDAVTINRVIKVEDDYLCCHGWFTTEEEPRTLRSSPVCRDNATSPAVSKLEYTVIGFPTTVRGNPEVNNGAVTVLDIMEAVVDIVRQNLTRCREEHCRWDGWFRCEMVDGVLHLHDVYHGYFW